MSKQAKAPNTPVSARIVVPGAPEKAFELFTAKMTEWWPLATHSVFRNDVDACVFEAKAGGRIFERAKDGREAEWGKVVAVEEPRMVKFTWHPGRPANTAQQVTVTFTPMMMFGTTVELEHSGFEVLGDKEKEIKAQYEKDWPGVLDKLAARGAK